MLLCRFHPIIDLIQHVCGSFSYKFHTPVTTHFAFVGLFKIETR
jgi:hypothetical protein